MRGVRDRRRRHAPRRDDVDRDRHPPRLRRGGRRGAHRRPARERLYGALPVAAMLVLTAIAAWSVTWAINPSDAWIDANRHLAYFAAFAAAVALAHLAGRRWSAVLGAITLSAVLISGYALMTKVLPGVLNPDEIYARLREPFGYWNSVGLAAAMGLPGLLWLGARRTGHGALNALAAPGVTLCVATILLAYSRGSLLAAGIGVALWFAIVPLRLRGVAVLALGAVGRRRGGGLDLRPDRSQRRPRRRWRRARRPATSSASRSPSCSSSCSPCRSRSPSGPPSTRRPRRRGARWARSSSSCSRSRRSRSSPRSRCPTAGSAAPSRTRGGR